MRDSWLDNEEIEIKKGGQDWDCTEGKKEANICWELKIWLGIEKRENMLHWKGQVCLYKDVEKQCHITGTHFEKV